MKIIVAGAGTIGYQVAKTLSLDGQDVVIIDPQAEVIRDALNRFDCMAVTGKANSLDDLESAGIADADFFIALTPSDEVNILSSALVSAEYSHVRTIARVRSGNYADTRLYRSLGSGIHYFINPELEATAGFLRSLAHGAVSDITTFRSLDVQVRTVAVGAGSRLANLSLEQLPALVKARFLVVLVARGDRYQVPQGKTQLREGDVLYVAALAEDFPDILPRLGKPSRVLNTVLLVGGDRISTQVASYLSGQPETPDIPGLDDFVRSRLFGRRRVRIVEPDKARCKELAELLPGVDVIRGDFADETLFDEEQLGDHDVMMALGPHEELNLVTAVYGKRRGIKRAMVLVNSPNYRGMAQHLDVDVALSLRDSVAATVLGIIRQGRVESVRTLGDGTVELLEFMPTEACPLVGRALKDLRFPSQTLVVAIGREGGSFIATGGSVLQPGDHVVVLTVKKHAEAVQMMFAPVPGDA